MLPDVTFINPGGRAAIYQNLDTAIEPPLWCRLLAGYVEDHGFKASIVDAEAMEMSIGTVALNVSGTKLAVLVVFGHQPSASTQQMIPAMRTAEAIRARHPDMPILIVGGHVAALPVRTLEEAPYIDYACNGEGLHTVLGLLQGDPIEDIPGLVWRWAGNIVNNPPAPLVDVKTLHGDAWHMLPMENYRAHNWQCFGKQDRKPYASIYTSLGCPFKCSFCCINAPFASNRYRMRSPESVVAEIDKLYTEYGVTTFKIVDEMFVLNERHYTEICEGLAAKPYDLNIWAYARIDTVKPEKLALLRRAGIQWLALGIESGSDHVRDGSEKHMNASDIVETVRAIRNAGINVIGNYIFGLPDDTLQTMRETLDLAKELNCEFANFYSAMAYPGSRLYETATDLPASWSGYSQHSMDTHPLPTETLSSKEVLALRDAAFTEYFTSHRYLAMVQNRFGDATLHEVQRMTSTRLERGA